MVARIASRADLPPPSHVLLFEAPRPCVLACRRLDIPRVEALQKQVARQLKTDPAAASCSQLTRLPGLFYLSHLSSRQAGRSSVRKGFGMRR
jgi:hypothetical protein